MMLKSQKATWLLLLQHLHKAETIRAVAALVAGEQGVLRPVVVAVQGPVITNES